MGVAAFVLGLGLLAFSEMKSVYSWVFLFVPFGSQAWEFKKRRESFSRLEECNLDSGEERVEDSGTKAFYVKLHARFTLKRCLGH